MVKVDAAIRSLPKEALFDILERAMLHVPVERLPEVLGRVVPLKEVEEGPAAAKALLQAVKRFHAETVAGENYDYFQVNSRNSSEMSEGTEDWIAEFRRLLDSCLAQAPVGPPEAVREAFELLLDLLRRLNDGEAIVFFADDSWSWQVPVQWDEVLPAYFRCISATAAPKEFAKVVRTAIKEFVGRDSANFLRVASRAATPEQKRALMDGRIRRGGR
mgnify:CR=1 FL=1